MNHHLTDSGIHKESAANAVGITIFLTLLIIVLQHRLVQRGRDISAARLNMASRLLFPVANVLAVYWLKLSFLG